MNKRIFLLKDRIYEVTNASIIIEKHEEGLVLFPEVNAENTDGSVDFEMSKLHLYHNNGFQTNVSSVEDLVGCEFVWTSRENSCGEEAGYLYVLGHQDVTEGKIEFISLNNDRLTISWIGLADVYWDEEFQDSVPFSCEFEVVVGSIKD